MLIRSATSERLRRTWFSVSEFAFDPAATALDAGRDWGAQLAEDLPETVPPAPDREPAAVALDPDAPGDLPVRGDVVTETGTVGCFSSEVNERLRQWREFGGRDAEEAARLRALMAAELGPDYAVA